MKLLDTNVIIRFLVKDDQALATKAKVILENSPAHSLELTLAVFLEISFVLSSFYELPKAEVIRDLALLISLPSINCNRSFLSSLLETYESNSISMVDAYLMTRIRLGKNHKIVTFDKKLEKLSQEIFS